MATYSSCWALALALVACTLPASVFSQLPPGLTLPPIPGVPVDLPTQTNFCMANEVLAADLTTCVNFGAALNALGVAGTTVEVYVYEVFTGTQPSASVQNISLGPNEMNTVVAGLGPGMSATQPKQLVVMVYGLNAPFRPIAVVGNSRLGVALTNTYAQAPGVMLSYAPGSMDMTSVDLRLSYPGATLKQRKYDFACYASNAMACNYAQRTDAPFELTPGDIHEFLPYLQISGTAIYPTPPIRVLIQDAAQANAMPSCIGMNCLCAAVGYVLVPIAVHPNITCKALGDAVINTTMVQSGDVVEVNVYRMSPMLDAVPVWNGTYTWTMTNELRPPQLALGEFYALVSRNFLMITHPAIAVFPRDSLGLIQQFWQNPSILLNQTAESNGMVTVSRTFIPLVYRPYSASCRTSLQGSCAYMELGESKALAPGRYEFAPYSPGAEPAYVFPPQGVTIGESSGAEAHLPSTIAMVMALFSIVALLI